ncbi:small integral membrane protein 12 isoform X2 [Passer montanus]|uniref:small integral membrane protein 12 isoform X2 n=1 Tax=Passer montanus TaxID=9160 RepID=UPI00195F67CE|nr:small integral membrane protein 12 isoform X2 [Passer montanus]
MWSVLWAAVRSKAPYVTFPVAFVVGLVGSQLEWFLRGDPPATAQEEKSISEQREDRKLQEIAGEDLTKPPSAPAALHRRVRFATPWIGSRFDFCHGVKVEVWT